MGLYTRRTHSKIAIDTDERLLAAARQDNEEMLLEVFEQGDYDINFQDGCVDCCPYRCPLA